MAGDEDNGLINLSFPQKLQLGAFGAGTLIFLLTYLISILLNGSQFTNQWILSNPVPVLAYWSIQIGLVPVYKRTDPKRIACLKQTIYKLLSIGAPFMLFWAYYQFNPPTTGIDRIVSKLSYVFTFASITGVILSGSYFKFSVDKE
jgi:hypothetical protein